MIFDCDFLFVLVLTPVNEYNIVDKIQSANNQLFASINEDHTMDVPKQTYDNCNDNNKMDRLMLQSKHRVTFSSDIEEYEDDLSEEDVTGMQYKDDDAVDKEIAEIIERDENAMVEHDKIDGLMKRMSIEETYSNDDGSASEDNDYATELEVVDDMNESIVEDTKIQSQSTPLTEHINPSNLQKVNDDEKIIVPLNESPCRACNKTNNTLSMRRGIKRPTTSHITTGFKRSTLPQTNRIASADTHRNSAHRDSNNQDDVLNIHLNVRACCENKYLDNNRLPRYNGYISQYGLSKDQLEMREMNRQKYLEKRARREREIIKAKQEIADLNEQAFRAWITRKNHVARPKCKNMYDEPVPKPRIKYHPSKKFSAKSNEHRS